MTGYLKSTAALLLLGFLALGNGQSFWSADQVGTPNWTAVGSSIQAGNGAFLSPDGSVLVVVSADGSVRGFKPSDGTQLWQHIPIDLQTSSSPGGAFFSSYQGKPFVLYSLVSNELFDDLATSQLIALNPSDGFKLYESAQMEGVTKGTPVTSSDGSLLVTTHNVANKKGLFSIFEYGAQTANLTYAAPVDGNSTLPFGAVGYFWNPTEGNYPEGAGNPNDLFMWAFDSPEGATEVGNGQMFAFQKPVLAGNWNVAKIGNATSFQTPNPPILTNGGYSLYWSITRSEQRFWQGDGRPRGHFASNFLESVKFGRGTPIYAAAGAPVTLSSDPVNPFVCGPTSANQIFRMPYDYSDSSVVVNTTSPLTSKVLISPDDMYVYYATKEGSLFQLEADTLKRVWNISLGAPVLGELAQSLDGAFVYVADATGGIRSFQVKDKVAGESIAPSASATTAPTPTVADNDVTSTPTFLKDSNSATTAPSKARGTSPTKSPKSSGTLTDVRIPTLIALVGAVFVIFA